MISSAVETMRVQPLRGCRRRRDGRAATIDALLARRRFFVGLVGLWLDTTFPAAFLSAHDSLD
jgi:hypothetical protein